MPVGTVPPGPPVTTYQEWERESNSRYANGYDPYHKDEQPYARREDISPRGGGSHSNYEYNPPVGARREDSFSGNSDMYNNRRPEYAARENPYARREEIYSRVMRQSYSNGNGNPSNGTTSGYYSDQQSNFSRDEDGVEYTLDHLATFTVGSQHGLLYPSDGMRKLRHMEKTSGIWTQRMILRVEKKCAIICELENGDCVERFPMEQLSEPTAVVSNDPKEMYNNILLFTVLEEPKKKSYSPSEMHIFQCISASAQEIVDEIRRVKSGKGGKSRSSGSHIPPPPVNPPPEPPMNGVHPGAVYSSQVQDDNSSVDTRMINQRRSGHTERCASKTQKPHRTRAKRQNAT